jgi:hypothetical protein
VKKNRILIVSLPVIIVLAAVLFYQRVYVKVQSDIATTREQQEVKMRMLKKSLALIAEKPELEKRLVALKEARKLEATKLLEGETISLVAASLQETLKSLIVSKAGTITSERVGKTEETDNFRVVSVTVDAVLPDSRSLAEVLYSIETRTPYLVIRDLDVRVRNFRQPREITVRMDIAALTATK